MKEYKNIWNKSIVNPGITLEEYEKQKENRREKSKEDFKRLDDFSYLETFDKNEQRDFKLHGFSKEAAKEFILTAMYRAQYEVKNNNTWAELDKAIYLIEALFNNRSDV